MSRVDISHVADAAEKPQDEKFVPTFTQAHVDYLASVFDGTIRMMPITSTDQAIAALHHQAKTQGEQAVVLHIQQLVTAGKNP